MDWLPPEKPAELTESRLIGAIIEGRFPAGTNLPAERELARQLGVTRPTLREVLQRMARDGWLEIRHGKPTRVRDYWTEGTLAVLVAYAFQARELPQNFVPNLLNIRILLCPTYTFLAVERDPDAVAALLEDSGSLDDDPHAFAAFDWRLHRQLTILSANPFFTMFINSVERLYQVIGEQYFAHEQSRDNSRQFYRDLLECARRKDAAAAGRVSEKIMTDSAELWGRIVQQ